jgi:hypothetical protein
MLQAAVLPGTPSTLAPLARMISSTLHLLSEMNVVVLIISYLEIKGNPFLHLPRSYLLESVII